jgi:hypothetical protein
MSSLLVFNRVYRLEIQSVMLIFSTQLCLPRPYPTSQSQKQLYTDSVWLGGGGVLSCVGDHILHEFNHSVSDQTQNLQNCYTTTNKKLGGEGTSDR